MVIHVRLCIAMLRRTGEEQLPNDVKSTNTTKIAMTFSGILIWSIGTFSLLGKDSVFLLLLTLQINTVLPMYQQCLDLGQQPFYYN